MAKKLLVGAAIFGLSVLLIAMLVPAISAELGSENPWDPVGEQKGFGPKDDDEDGIPNGQDADYEPNENCTEDGPHGEMKQSKGTEQGSSEKETGNGTGNSTKSMYRYKGDNEEKGSESEETGDGTGSMNKNKGKSSDQGSGDKIQAKDQSCLE